MKETYCIKDNQIAKLPEEIVLKIADLNKKPKQKRRQPSQAKNKTQDRTWVGFHSETREITSTRIEQKNRRTVVKILKIVYGLIGISVIISSLFLIALCALGSIVFRNFHANSAGRVASLIVVAFTVAVGVLLAVYGITTAVRNDKKSLHKISVTYMILGVMLLALSVFSVHMSTAEEAVVLQVLNASFKMVSMDHRVREKRVWDNVQTQLECCGVSGPHDYRHRDERSPPEVPASCCVSFDPDKPAHAQRKMRAVCRRTGTYYTDGCSRPLLEALLEASELVYGVAIIVVVFCLVQATLGILLAHLMKRWRDDIADQPVAPDLVRGQTVS